MKAPIFEEMDKAIEKLWKAIDSLDKTADEIIEKDKERMKEYAKCNIIV